MSSQSKIVIGTILASIALLVGLSMFGSTPKEPITTSPETAELLQPQLDDWINGNPEAGVTLVEYLDFECEACRAFYPFVKQLQTDFPSELRVITRYFPLPGHKNSMTAALAAEAAGQQGKFWEMHDILFENQDAWGNKQVADPTLFVKYAEMVGLNMEQFKNQTDSALTAARVRRDQASGKKLGANATPTFFLNGVKIEGVRSYDQFKALVEAEIVKAGGIVTKQEAAKATVATSTEIALVDLPVPFVTQLPDGVMEKPWSKACEEASIVMVEQFYLKNKTTIIGKNEVKKLLNPLFAWENKNLGYNDDTSATDTARIVNEHTSFSAVVKTNPTLEEMKQELRSGRPIISMHYGPGLKNPYLHFKADGPQYHVIVLKGYDDVKSEFIAHDPGTYQYQGNDYRYSYEVIINSLRDYTRQTDKADGQPVVLFTAPKSV